MQVDMYYWKTCGSGGHVNHENMSWEDMSSRWACLTGLCRTTIEAVVSLGNWCFLFFSNIFFFLL